MTIRNDTTTAETILAQLGGPKFLAMTGARNLLSDERSLSLSLPRGFARDGINRVTIALSEADLYTATFYRVGTARSGYRVEELARVEDLYAEDLRSTFTSKTGLETSLGTCSARAE